MKKDGAKAKKERNPIRLQREGDIFYTIKKKLKVETPLQIVACLKTSEKIIKAERLNVIAVSCTMYEQIKNETLVLYNEENGGFLNVCAIMKETCQDDEICITSYVKERLKSIDGGQLYLCRYCSYAYAKIQTQKIDHIRENNLIISSKDKNGRAIFDFKTSPYALFEVYNAITGDNVIVKREHIYVDETLPQGTIRLNRKQRICLGEEFPLYLSEKQWNILMKNIPFENRHMRETLAEVYGERRVAIDNVTYEQKQIVKQALQNYGQGELRIIPVLESQGKTEKRTLLRALTDFYVGKSTLSLVCRRPYEVDEGADIVRMSVANMRILGIEEMDRMILQYKKRKVCCRVLELSEKEAFYETNLPISPDMAIGIPVHIRKKLGITDLNSTVKIDRDTAFIFRKNLNEQIVPILLTLFSANVFTDQSVILSALLSVVAIPIVLYINLSSKRNMRA